MTKHYKIEKNIKMPTKRLGSKKYPFDKMGVGDSFTVPIKASASVSGSAKAWGDRQEIVHKFAQRRIDDKTIRVWRIS